eukprot:15040911-Alexandrium_andersonii.AAC.1
MAQYAASSPRGRPNLQRRAGRLLRGGAGRRARLHAGPISEASRKAEAQTCAHPPPKKQRRPLGKTQKGRTQAQ